MKSPVLLSIICIALGVAIGWFAKPETTEKSTENSQAKEIKHKPAEEIAAKAPSPRTREITPSVRVLSSNDEEMTEEEKAEFRKMDSRMSDMMKKRQQQKLDARITKLVAELNLTPAQEAELRKMLAAQMEGLGDLKPGDFNPGMFAGLSGIMNGSAVDDALANLLTDDQKEVHEALKKRERGNKIEARALKDLAKLSSLDLSQEQKDQVYDILYKQAETSVDKQANSAENAMVSAFTEGFGIEIDSADLGLPEGFITGAAVGEAANGEAPNPEDMFAKMKAAREEKIENQIEALSPVLNDQQLEQYRNDLKRNSGGIFGGFLGGFGSEEEGE